MPSVRATAVATVIALGAFVPGGLAAHDAPQVIASIKPVHSLTARVMQGVGTPALLISGAASPHDYSLKPSEAAALEDAAAVVWIGPDLETFLEDPLATLADDARSIRLQDSEGLIRLKFREGGPFEPHAHGNGHEHDGHGHDGHGHADGHSHDHDAEHAHGHDHDQGHAHEHDDDHGHDHDRGHDHGHAHGDFDGHYWLDPLNAAAMAGHIADALAEIDPAHAATYRANAADAAADYRALSETLQAELAPIADRPFLVFHDAYQYMENRFDLRVAGSITVNPAVMPGARRVAELQEKVRDLGATCVFAEPQFEPRLIAVVVEGTPARSGVLDPLGTDIAPGADFYPTLMRSMADSLRACLAGDP